MNPGDGLWLHNDSPALPLERTAPDPGSFTRHAVPALREARASYNQPVDAILALDQGTTSSRAMLFDADASVIASAQREFRQLYPEPGWVEHDPLELWTSQIETAAEAMNSARGVRVAAIGLTNQRETTILWDRADGKPIANAVVWQDRRTAGICATLRAAGHEPLFRSRTGLLLDPYFSGTKIRWLLDQVPDARTRASRGELAFGTVDSWLLWNLTGGRLHATDATNASRTLMYDIHRECWDEELLEILDVPRSLLPEVRRSSEYYGETASGLPIPAGIPITGVAGDQQASLFGQGCVTPGMSKNTYGTGSFVVLNTGHEVVESSHGLLATIGIAHRDVPLHYALEGSIFVTGAAVQWLRDELGIIDSASDVESLAASVSDSGGVTFVPAFTGLGAPHWDASARGALLGLTRGTGPAHIARATLEAIALQCADVLDAMQQDSGIPIRELRVDGGGTANDLLMQMQADIAGIPVLRSRIAETTALGAARLAAIAAGIPTSHSESARQLIDRVFEPSSGADERTRQLRDRWREGLSRARGWTSSNDTR